jgi:hypothetical protein
MTSAFYPGAGLDMSPIVLCPDIKHWYYFDSQPLSEYGSYIINKNTYSERKERFIRRLGTVFHQIGFECVSIIDSTFLFLNHDTATSVTYYINKIFPDDLGIVPPCGFLVMCGFDIESAFTDSMNKSPSEPQSDRLTRFLSEWDGFIIQSKSIHPSLPDRPVREIVWDESEYFLDANQTESFITIQTRK